MTASFSKRSAMASSNRRPKFARPLDHGFRHSASFCADNPSMPVDFVTSTPLIATQDDVESEKGLTAKLSRANEKAHPSVVTSCETRLDRQNSVLRPVSIACGDETRPDRQEAANDDEINVHRLIAEC